MTAAIILLTIWAAFLQIALQMCIRRIGRLEQSVQPKRRPHYRPRMPQR